MLKFNEKDLEILYEGVKELLKKETEFPEAELQSLQMKILQATEMSESVKENRPLNENVQILDKVYYKNQRGYISGQIDGKWIVQVQGSTYLVEPSDLREYNKKPDPAVKPPMKFDDRTQALLFEQYVKCGIYQGNVPIKLHDCYVRYSHWEKAQPDQQVKVLIEGMKKFMPKSSIKILENLNDFANEDNYVPGVIVDNTSIDSEEAISNILVHAIDYTTAIGDADAVRVIITNPDGEPELQTMPKSAVRTLSV